MWIIIPIPSVICKNSVDKKKFMYYNISNKKSL